MLGGSLVCLLQAEYKAKKQINDVHRAGMDSRESTQTEQPCTPIQMNECTNVHTHLPNIFPAGDMKRSKKATFLKSAIEATSACEGIGLRFRPASFDLF